MEFIEYIVGKENMNYIVKNIFFWIEEEEKKEIEMVKLDKKIITVKKMNENFCDENYFK